MLRRLARWASILVVCVGVGCGPGEVTPAPRPTSENIRASVTALPFPAPVHAESPRYRVVTEMGDFVIAVAADQVPRMAEAFDRRVRSGFYEGSVFYRTIPGELVQVGKPVPGMEDPISGSFSVEGDAGPHGLGTVGIVRKEDPQAIRGVPEREEFTKSSGREFFVCIGRMPHLDGRYTMLGRVVEGLDVVRDLSKEGRGTPIRQVVAPLRDKEGSKT